MSKNKGKGLLATDSKDKRCEHKDVVNIPVVLGKANVVTSSLVAGKCHRSTICPYAVIIKLLLFN